jgi:DNA topoisomerase-1
MVGKTTLVIVESPGKISKMTSILRKIDPSITWIVMASYGHIIDLDNKSMSVNIENDFTPKYKAIDSRKRLVIKKLKAAYSKCNDIIIATDKDREGEMIGWSVARELKVKNPKRLVFKAITDLEIKNAMKKPATIDNDIVKAQQARRVMDRILGFEISPILWKGSFYGSAAGRVMSVVVRLLIDREDQIKKFMESNNSSFYKFHSEHGHKNGTLKGTMIENDKKRKVVVLTDKNKVKTTLEKISKSTTNIVNIHKKTQTRNPLRPFTTSTLQQEASRTMGWSIKKTMSVAQKLYEKGKITYMRTDSVNLSSMIIEQIKSYVTKEFGKKYINITHYKAKGSTQEAHEAIRPMAIKTKGITGSSDESRLYTLIWKRTVASQMSAAEFLIHSVDMDISKLKNKLFTSDIKTIKFDGYLKVYNVASEDSDETNLKVPKISDDVFFEKVLSKEEYKRAPARYSEASLVNKLDPKNLNIGRPATYVPIIEKIQTKGYVKFGDVDGKEVKVINFTCTFGKTGKISENIDKIKLGQDKNKLIPTESGKVINTFLVKHFADIMKYEFTSDMEKNLDKIAKGNTDYKTVMTQFYANFHPTVEKLTKQDIKLETKTVEKVLLSDDNYTYALMPGKYGKYIIRKDKNDKACGKCPMNKPLTEKNITLEKVQDLFKYPMVIGTLSRKKIKFFKHGKNGPYVKIGTDNFSIDLSKVKEEDISVEYVKNLLEQKKKSLLWQKTEKNLEYTVKESVHGYYVAVRNTASKTRKKPFMCGIPKDVDFETLTIEQIKGYIVNKKSYKKRNWKKK